MSSPFPSSLRARFQTYIDEGLSGRAAALGLKASPTTGARWARQVRTKGHADTAYGLSDNLIWPALKRQILPFIPVFDKGERTDGPFSRSDFSWDEDNNRFTCPGWKEMRHTWRTYSDPARNAPSCKAHKYRALKSDCTGCAPADNRTTQPTGSACVPECAGQI